MNTAHTPGPWIASRDPDAYSDDDCCIGVPDGKVDQIAVCSKRDASLISAAPDMYEALKMAPNPHDYDSPDDCGAASAEWFAGLRRAALAKARGQ